MPCATMYFGHLCLCCLLADEFITRAAAAYSQSHYYLLLREKLQWVNAGHTSLRHLSNTFHRLSFLFITATSCIPYLRTMAMSFMAYFALHCKMPLHIWPHGNSDRCSISGHILSCSLLPLSSFHAL